MPFETSEALSTSKAAAVGGARLIEKLMGRIVDSLQKHEESAPAKYLAKELGAGAGLQHFICKRDVAEEYIGELKARGIPYLRTRTWGNASDEVGVMVLERDVEIARALQKDLLIQKSSFYREVSLGELEQSVLRAGKSKELVFFSDLSEQEEHVLKEQCGRLGYGFTVGVDALQNGTNVLACQAEKVITPPDKADICLAYTEMTMFLYGPAAEAKRRQIEREKAFQKLVDEDFASKGGIEKADVWIIGASDDRHYMKINEHGYEFGECIIDGDHVIFDAQEKVSSILPDYESMRDAHLARIDGKYHTYDTSEVIAYFRGELVLADGTDKQSRTVQKGERELAKTIHAMAEEHMPKTKDAKEQFEIYQKEATTIMRAMIEKKTPRGYSEEDMSKIRSVLEEYKIDPHSYVGSLERLERAEVDSYTPGHNAERRIDIDKALAKAKEVRGGEGKKKEKER